LPAGLNPAEELKTMADAYGTETPSSKIGAALATLALAIRLNAEVRQGRIDVSIY